MLPMTPVLLQAVTGCPPDLANEWAHPISDAMAYYSIDTPARASAFLAQIGHESMGFVSTSEGWGPTVAQKKYEGNKDLGNTQPGDAFKFRGHGLIQITGRFNHARVRDQLRAEFGDEVPDFEADPEALTIPRWAALSAAAYWDDKHLNPLADIGDMETITKRINGGLNGYPDRLARWERAKRAFVAALQSAAPLQPTAPPAAEPEPAPTPRYLPRQNDNEGWPEVTQTEAPAAPEPTPEKPMLPFLGALAQVLIPSLAGEIPRVAKIFPPSSPVAERNLGVAQVVLDVVTKALGAANAQEAVERVKNDPAAAQAARDAIDANWFRIEEVREASVDKARAFMRSGPERIVCFNMVFHELLALIFVVCTCAGMAAAFRWGELDQATKNLIVTAALIGGFLGIKEFFFGGSRGSDRKTEILEQRDR